MATNKNIKINLDYSQFSGGIKECQQKMALLTQTFKMQESALGNNASEVDKLTLSQSMLQQKINLQIQAVEKASERFNAMAQSAEATESQVDKAQMAYMKQITTLNNLTNELNSVNDKLDEARQAEDEAANGSNMASGSMENLGASILNTVAMVSSFVATLQQASQEIIAIATASTQWADDLMTLSSQAGLSTQTLQELSYAANFVDVSVETMQSSMTKLTQKMAEAQNGSTSAQNAFQNLGVSVTNADGSLKSTEQVFYEVIDALGQVDNAAQRDADAMSIFGKSAQDLNPLIDQGSQALQKYGEEAENLGLVMSQEDVEALAEMQNSFDKLSSVMDAAGNRASAAIAPAFASIADAIADVDPHILTFVAGMGKVVSIVGSVSSVLAPMAQIYNTLKIAKTTVTMATTAETAAEGGLALAAGAANVALAPQILIIGTLVASLAVLAAAISSIISAYKEYKEAAEAAGKVTVSFSDAIKGENADMTFKPGSKHYALGGRSYGGQVWVGEQGAELVDLPAGSYVHNTTESNQISNGGNVTNITVNVDHISELSDLLRISQQAQQRSRMGVNS